MRLTHVIPIHFCAIGIGLIGTFLAVTAHAQPGRNSFVPDSSRPPAASVDKSLRVDPAAADPVADRPQIAAATAAAVENLRDEIAREPLTGRLTVADFLKRTGGEDALSRELARAELIGGARWLDDQTCQIQLQISGPRVTHVLRQIAANSKTSPLSPDEIEKLTQDWRRRDFTATGSSTAFSRIAAARPRNANAAWAGVPDVDREHALGVAKDDAIARTLSSIRSIPLGRKITVADALAVKEINSALVDWLANRPVIRVNYRRDLQVELTLAGTPDGLYDVLRRVADRHPELDLPTRESDWARVRIAFEDRMETIIGHGTVTVNPAAPNMAVVVPVAPAVQPVRLPLGAPRWSSEQVSVIATQDAGTSKLKAARAAETIARHKLVEKVNSLPLTATLNVGQASEQDPRITDAVHRAVDRARIGKTDYYHGKDVQVEMTLDLRDVWDQIRAIP